ncbi:hypothetical protein OSB04_005822 [Centaurea solstitialis]|uniref:F-box domain-containing protein n=1 Tax=Centaurea solstitialis TaxID=347529 RepID=A0AA38WGU7_9ASTR|nr:hypothetical protein OSB04_005822 [Centaurea solstitialis]
MLAPRGTWSCREAPSRAAKLGFSLSEASRILGFGSLHVSLREVEQEFSDDHLGRFSDDVLVRILSRLSIKHAVVTSVLSRRWRQLWRQTARLDFEDNHRWNKIQSRPAAARNDPTIDEFKISFDLAETLEGEIDNWIKFAVSKDVQRLELDLKGSVFRKERNYLFPNKFFPRKSKPSLIGSPFMEIKFLKDLLLNWVDVNDEGLENILTNCPVLEHLSIHGSWELRKAKIHGKGLALRSLEITDCERLESVEICDSNLVSLNCTWLSSVSYRLESLEKLEKICICDYKTKINHMFSQISCNIPNLQVLELTIYYSQEDMPFSTFPKLPQLKQLIVEVYDGELPTLTSMVEACPNLQRFKAKVKYWKSTTSGLLNKVVKQTHQHLEEVEIDGYDKWNCDDLLELATYFIVNSGALKRLVIKLVEENDAAARDRAQQQLEPKTTPVGVELEVECNLSMSLVGRNQGSKWRETWRGDEAKPQVLGVMAKPWLEQEFSADHLGRLSDDVLVQTLEGEIDNWIKFAVSKDVQRLELDLKGSVFRKERNYLFPNKFFPRKSLENILTNCPVLEHLSIHGSWELRKAKIHGKGLALRSLEITDCERLESVEICDSNLVSLNCTWLSSVSYRLESLEKLEKICICDYKTKINHMFSQISCNIPNLQVLELTIYYSQEDMPFSTFPKLPQLKQLIVEVYDGELPTLTSMVEACPNLQRFKAKVKYWKSTTSGLLNKVVKQTHQHLEEVEIDGYDKWNCDDLLELATYFIVNSGALKRLVIKLVEENDATARDRAQQQFQPKTTPVGVELEVECNLTMSLVGRNQGSKWRETWRGDEAKPQVLGVMAKPWQTLEGEIDNWIKFAVSKDVQRLELDLKGSVFRMERNYLFPNKFFPRKSKPSLIGSPFMEIKFLKDLLLNWVDVNDEGLENILTNCPVLEHLSIHGSWELRKAKIHGKGLVLRSLEITDCERLESVEICDSNLVSLNCTWLSSVSYRLESLEKLEKICICDYKTKINHMFSQISCNIPNLQVLELTIYYSQEDMPFSTFPKLPQLKQLIVEVYDGELPTLTSMVKYWKSTTSGLLNKVAKQTHQHLEEVEIDGYDKWYCDDLLELATYFIVNSGELKRLVIKLVEENDVAARDRVQQQLGPKTTPVGVELMIEVECNLTMSLVGRNQGSKWRETWRGDEAKPQVLGVMAKPWQTLEGEIDNWIKFAVSKDVQRLELDLKGSVFRMERNYLFPNKFFPRKSKPSLIGSPFMEIKFLKDLLLNWVDVNDEGLENILTNCPVLEHLSIHGSWELRKAKIHGKGLVLRSLEITDCERLESVEICDSNLVSLNCTWLSSVSYRLESLEKLEKICICDYKTKINHMFSQISCNIPNLQVLELTIYYSQEDMPFSTFPKLPQLKQLIVEVYDGELPTLTSMVKYWKSTTSGLLNKVAKQTHQHLEEVEIDGYDKWYCDDLLELATYFIVNSGELKRLVIKLVEENDAAARDRVQQQLGPKTTPVGVELVIV